MKAATTSVLAAVLTWTLYPALAEDPPTIASESVEPISSITLTRVNAPLELKGTFLQTGENREQHMLVRISEGDAALREMLLTSDRASGALEPTGRSIQPGVSVWIWGTNDGLRVVSGGLARDLEEPQEPTRLRLGAEYLTESSLAYFAPFECVVLLDYGDEVVLLLYDSLELAGMRFVSSDASNAAADLYWRSLILLSNQHMARVQDPRHLPLPAEPGHPTHEWPPAATCCPSNCTQCCCHATRSCTSSDDSSNCDGRIVCQCEPPSSCSCGPPAQ